MSREDKICDLEKSLEKNISLIHEDKVYLTRLRVDKITRDQEKYFQLTGKYYITNEAERVMNDMDKYGDSGVA
jgi:hypothetical protein